MSKLDLVMPNQADKGASGPLKSGPIWDEQNWLEIPPIFKWTVLRDYLELSAHIQQAWRSILFLSSEVKIL